MVLLKWFVDTFGVIKAVWVEGRGTLESIRIKVSYIRDFKSSSDNFQICTDREIADWFRRQKPYNYFRTYVSEQTFDQNCIRNSSLPSYN